MSTILERYRLGSVCVAAMLVALGGCATAPADAKRASSPVSEDAIPRFGPVPEQPPVLANESQPVEYVRFALVKHPAVAAAWSDWRAAQAAVIPAKSLPDPQLTFQADIASTVMSLMPGVMFDLMAPGKRAAMGREAEAAAEIADRNYTAALVRVAAETRRALVDLAYLDEAIRLREASVASAQQTGQLAASEYASGRGMGGSLDVQLRAADEAARLRSEITTLGERRTAARARLKSALGLLPTDPDPAWPRQPLQATSLPSADELWRRIQTSNPELATMRSMVEMAVAGVEVAKRAGTPDFTAGLMTDVKQSPWMWRPTATMTLPVWRGKIHELLDSAQARKQAADARLVSGQLEMAAGLARMLAMVREADQMIEYIDSSGLPSLERAIATSASGYRTGGGGAVMIAQAGAMENAMRFERLVALRDREQAVVELLAMTAGVMPAQQ